MSMTDAELEGLSDEERAALADQSEDDATEAETLAALAKGDDDDAEDTAADVDDDVPAEPEPFVPRYQADPVADFDEQMQQLAEQKKTLRTQYLDGDLDLDDYEDQREQIEAQTQALREANLKATLAAEQSQQAAAQRWEWEQERFFSQKANSVYKDDALLAASLDAAIKALASDQSNASRPMSWYLEEADRQVRERFNRLAPAGAAPAQHPTAKSKGKPPVPPSLADMPTAELNETGGNDEFAHLDKLNGMALEAALAKLPPSEAERYLRTQ